MSTGYLMVVLARNMTVEDATVLLTKDMMVVGEMIVVSTGDEKTDNSMAVSTRMGEGEG